MAELWYNTTLHSAIGLSPYKALYGRQPPSISCQTPSTKVEVVDNFIRNRVVKRESQQGKRKDDLVC